MSKAAFSDDPEVCVDDETLARALAAQWNVAQSDSSASIDEDFLLASYLQEEWNRSPRDEMAYHSPSNSNSKVSLGSSPYNSVSNPEATFHHYLEEGEEDDFPVLSPIKRQNSGSKGGGGTKPRGRLSAGEFYKKIDFAGNQKKESRQARVEVNAPTAAGLDGHSRHILRKLVDGDTFADVGGIIAQGKEATVHHALDSERTEFAVKIYKTTKVEFRDREKYIAGEHRFRHVLDLGNRRKMIKLWAEKEVRNLKRLRSAGILCPEPILLKQHVVVMGFLGIDGFPAPQLGQVKADRETFQDLYWDCVALLWRIYHRSNLVHADFGARNLLVHNRQLYVIDMAQAVTREHPRAFEFLRRDCFNITRFFKSRGVSQMLTTRELYDFIVCKRDLPAVENVGMDGEDEVEDELNDEFNEFNALESESDEGKAPKKMRIDRGERLEELFGDLFAALKETTALDRVLTREEEIEEDVWLRIDLPRDLNDVNPMEDLDTQIEALWGIPQRVIVDDNDLSESEEEMCFAADSFDDDYLAL